MPWPFAKRSPRYRVPDGERVYAVGDVHGCSDLLTELHELIRHDAEGAAGLTLTIVYLGDYVDRGEDSRGVVDILLGEPIAGARAVHLMGNHDQWLLEFLDHPRRAVGWFMNGADQTLASYGVDSFGAMILADDADELRATFAAQLPSEHEAFFRGLRPSHRIGDYFFAHAGIRPGVPLEQQDEDDLYWIRDTFLDSEEDFGVIVVHGHTPEKRIAVRPNRIGIDTGAVWTECLSCLVLEGDARRFLQTGGHATP